MYYLWAMILLRMSGWQKSSCLIPKSFYQSIGQFMACDEFYAIDNEIHYLLGIGISSKLS